MKKALAFLLVLIFLMICTVAFTSCGGDDNETPPAMDNGGTDDFPSTENNGTTEQPSTEDQGQQDSLPMSNGLELTLNEDGESYSVTGIGICADEEIIISSRFNGLPVTGIGEKAFYRCSTFKRIVIPNSVTNIGDLAFGCCNALENITIPDSVTSIGGGAFWSCDSLKSASLGNGITEIKSYYFGVNCHGMFEDCESLTNVIFSNKIENIGEEAFCECGSLDNVEIPDSVVKIDVKAFYNCASLTNLVIPASVATIGRSAFSLCTSIKTIVIPALVKSLDSTFFGCTSLTDVTIHSTIETLGTGVFNDCESLMNINFEGTMEQWRGIRKGNWNYNTPRYTIHCQDGDLDKFAK